MTDNENIKALKACVNLEDCEKCPRYEDCEISYDRDYVGVPDVLVLSLDINKHQKAEIERLQKTIELMKGAKCVYSYDGETLEYCTSSPCPISKTVDQIKAEAVKEFAERLKAKKAIHFCKCGEPFVYTDLFNGEIDNLVKEMENET